MAQDYFVTRSVLLTEQIGLVDWPYKVRSRVREVKWHHAHEGVASSKPQPWNIRALTVAEASANWQKAGRKRQEHVMARSKLRSEDECELGEKNGLTNLEEYVMNREQNSVVLLCQERTLRDDGSGKWGHSGSTSLQSKDVEQCSSGMARDNQRFNVYWPITVAGSSPRSQRTIKKLEQGRGQQLTHSVAATCYIEEIAAVSWILESEQPYRQLFTTSLWSWHE